uniref:Uncharacterized protein n=1 Tax=Arundo donax TaxID=35708 RepID=A0A0A9HAX9_ARUDO
MPWVLVAASWDCSILLSAQQHPQPISSDCNSLTRSRFAPAYQPIPSIKQGLPSELLPCAAPHLGLRCCFSFTVRVPIGASRGLLPFQLLLLPFESLGEVLGCAFRGLSHPPPKMPWPSFGCGRDRNSSTGSSWLSTQWIQFTGQDSTAT